MKSILAVDDDPISRTILHRIILSIHHQPILAESGNEAWAILQDNPRIDLVITDCEMANMGGRELNQKIRAHPQLCELPLIMVSGYVSYSDVANLLDAGVSRFLPKPVDLSELSGYIRQLLGERYGSCL